MVTAAPRHAAILAATVIVAACSGHQASPTSADAQLVQATATFGLSLNAPAARAFPLFGPVREAEWAQGWAPSFLFPRGGVQQEGAVFTTPGVHGHSGLWVLTDYDATSGRIGYVIVSPGNMLTQIRIQVAPEGATRSRATVTYRRTALSAASNAQAPFPRQWEDEQRVHWEHAINAALGKHP